MIFEHRIAMREDVEDRRLGTWSGVAFDGGWLVIDCPWCGADAGSGYPKGDDLTQTVDVATCPDCGREFAILLDQRGAVVERLMSPADALYLAWLGEQGRPTRWVELVP